MVGVFVVDRVRGFGGVLDQLVESAVHELA